MHSFEIIVPISDFFMTTVGGTSIPSFPPLLSKNAWPSCARARASRNARRPDPVLLVRENVHVMIAAADSAKLFRRHRFQSPIGFNFHAGSSNNSFSTAGFAFAPDPERNFLHHVVHDLVDLRRDVLAFPSVRIARLPQAMSKPTPLNEICLCRQPRRRLVGHSLCGRRRKAPRARPRCDARFNLLEGGGVRARRKSSSLLPSES